ncbi:MAG: RNA polymerase sigma-70 factor [Bacteroidota bacterium]
MNRQSKSIIQSIKNGDNEAFEELFKRYYNPLFNLAFGILKTEDTAEEQVQEVFIKLWERRSMLKMDTKLFSYLVVSVRNRCYNCIRDQKVEKKYAESQVQQYRDQIFSEEYNQYDEALIGKLHQAIDQMPEKCREVFKLSRFEGLSHKQIAERLSISTKTIENHITKGMKILRAKLLSALFFIISSIGEL